MSRGSGMSRDEHRELVLSAVMKIQRPLFITALTTVTAFASFCFTSVAPCREFGYFASFGVAVAFIVAISLIPALLIIRGPYKRLSKKANLPEQAKQKNHMDISTFLADNLVTVARGRKTILFLVFVGVIIALYGISHLIIDNVMVEYFRADTDIYRSDVFMRQQFGGSKIISVVVEADSPNVILRPDTLAAMDGLSVYMQRKVPNVGKVMGFTDLVKRINQVFNVDESPDGMGNGGIGNEGIGNGEWGVGSGETSSIVDDFGFGFDNADLGFGFGDFGFDDSPVAAGHERDAASGADRERIYTQAELLALFDRAGTNFRGMNANDLIWELKRQVNHEGASYYEIPLDPKRYGKENPAELQRLIANYLVLLSGNISSYANDPLEPTAIKSTVQLRTMGMADSAAIFREIEQYVAANFPPDVKVTLGGTTMVEGSLNDLVVQSQLISIIISILCIFVVISISNKSLLAGCISIVPLTISMLINFAVMGFAGIKLNLGTSMVAAVAVGVGIDYTIHCLEAYKREWRATNGGGDFLRRTFASSGKAIIVNAVSVGAGFAVLMFSRFTMLADLGLLIAIAMLSSALASLTVLPALLSVIKPKFIYHTN
jgi:predicted RND superfamily exporter protein